MATTHVLPTRIAEAEPYKGDDWAQSMSRWMATPMFLMGAMAVALSLALGIVGGVSIGDFFGNLANPDLNDLGRAEAFGPALRGRRLPRHGVHPRGDRHASGEHRAHPARRRPRRPAVPRDRAAEVAQALERSPHSHVMLMGVMAEVGAFVVGIVAALSIGGVNPAAIADPATASAGDLADIGVAQAAATWLPGLRLLGIATLLTSLVLVLLTIQKVLRFQAARVSELATTGPIPVGSVPTQPSSGGGVPADQPAAWRSQLHQRLGRSA